MTTRLRRLLSRKTPKKDHAAVYAFQVSNQNEKSAFERLPPEILLVIFSSFIPPMGHTGWYLIPPFLYGYSSLTSLALTCRSLLSPARFSLYSHPRISSFRALQCFYQTISTVDTLREMVQEMELQFDVLQDGRGRNTTFLVNSEVEKLPKVDISIEMRMLGICRLSAVSFLGRTPSNPHIT
ncbi:hypothetical protein BT69DRAFT_247142 [Atractiella rhizophila]|nr:hypothetical protein BT69DRAFT_247142 [Atractiella rhizophila]